MQKFRATQRYKTNHILSKKSKFCPILISRNLQQLRIPQTERNNHNDIRLKFAKKKNGVIVLSNVL